MTSTESTPASTEQRRWPVVQPRRRPTGKAVSFPSCGDWACDDDEDWDVVAPTDAAYSSVKREYEIAYYHEPRTEWPRRLREERDRLNGGSPLWYQG